MEMKYEDFVKVLQKVSESKNLNENNLLERIKSEMNENNLLERIRSEMNENNLLGIESELEYMQPLYFTCDKLKVDKTFMVSDSGETIGYTLLHLAVKSNNVKIVEYLLKNKAKVDKPINKLDRAKSKLTALHIAASHGYQEIIRLLLDANANPLLENSEGITPRGMVGNIPNKDIVTEMLKEGEQRYVTSQSEARATRRQTYRSSNTLLQPNNKASGDCRNNEQTSLNSITNANKVDDTLEREQAPREREAKAQQLKEAKRFAANRKRVEQEYLHNQYLEQCALHNGEQDSLDLTTDESSSNDSGIYVPTEEAHEDLAKYLEEYEGDVDAKDGNGRTFLHFAVEINNEKSVKLLIARGADVNAQDKDERTPLHFAAAMSGMGIVKYLVENRADVNAQDKDERTPLHFAVVENNEELVELLIEHGANVDAQNKDGLTPLHYAVAARNGKLVKLLIAHGANIDAQDRAKHTPLYHAVANDNKKLAKLLIKHGADRSLIKDEDLIDRLNSMCSQLSEAASSHSKTNNATEVQKKEGAEKLKVKLKRSRAQLEEGQKEHQSLKRKIHDLENENVALKNKLEKTKNQHSETNEVLLEKAQKDLVELKNCVAGHETRLKTFDKLYEENKSLKQKVQNLERENAALNGELEEIKNQHSSYIAEHEAKLKAFNKLDEENKSLKQKIKDLESKNVTLNSELEKNKNQHSQTSEMSLKKVEKKPPLSKVAYVSLVATSVVGSILSIVSGLFVLSIIATSVAAALVAGGITYTMSKPITELKEVSIQSPDNNKACAI